MADEPISALTLFTSYSTADEVEILDVSDTTFASTGTNKRIQFSALLSMAGVVHTAGSSALPTTVEIHPDPTAILSNGNTLIAAVATGQDVFLYPGTYHLGTQTLTLATNGQSIVGVPGGECTVHIQSVGTPVIRQTATVVHLRNLLIDNDPSVGSTGFCIDVAGATANAGSTYDHLSFVNCADGIVAFHDSATTRNLSGVWSWISNPNGAILRAPYGQIPNGFVATDIVGATECIYTQERDNSSGTQSVDFNGRVQRFVCGDQFLGCTGLSGNIGPLAVITDGICGKNSIGIGASIQAGAISRGLTAATRRSLDQPDILLVLSPPPPVPAMGRCSRSVATTCQPHSAIPW